MIQVGRIILIGFRGAGKTTVAKLLCHRLKWKYISTDGLIEKLMGKTVAEIVKQDGWKKFRKSEHRIIQSIADYRTVIVDSGGGIVENEKNMTLLMPDSFTIWIDADESDLLERILSQPGQRPLLSQDDYAEDLKEYYHRRRPLYHQYADLHINSSGKSATEIVDIILEKLKFRASEQNRHSV